MGYQESKWDPAAVSYTGVQGLMQLTEDTALMMRSGDRRDPRSSIFGGAKYLSRMMTTVPQRISQPDRTWFAVASYNVGYGHLEDARILAQRERLEDVEVRDLGGEAAGRYPTPTRITDQCLLPW
jgi:membrane-bound lytic murein transglycosylase F